LSNERKKEDLIEEISGLQEANKIKLNEMSELKKATMAKTLELEKQLLEMSRKIKMGNN
jgi:hypothetical protein